MCHRSPVKSTPFPPESYNTKTVHDVVDIMYMYSKNTEWLKNTNNNWPFGYTRDMRPRRPVIISIYYLIPRTRIHTRFQYDITG